jgi:outer membrane protein assembly factor BamD (BamD/ComL family)
MGPAEIGLLVGGGVMVLVIIVYFVIAGTNPEAGSPIDHKGIEAEYRQDISTVEAGEMLEAAKSFENLEEFEYGEQIIRYQKVISSYPGTPQAQEARERIANVRIKERREW